MDMDVMIVCSCNVIKKAEIEEVVHGFLEDDAWQLVTIGMVYRAMAMRGKCCGCFPNAISIIVDAVESWHLVNNTPSAKIIPFIQQTRKTLEAQDRLRRDKREKVRSSRAA